jgi:hypothetical protein
MTRRSFIVMHAPVLHCVICRRGFDFQAGDAPVVLRHVAYGYDFVHDGACFSSATELMFPEPGFDCEAFVRDPERRRLLSVAPANGWLAARREPLLCWVLVEYGDGTTSMEGVIRDDEWLDEPGGAEFAGSVQRIHVAEDNVIRLAAA